MSRITGVRRERMEARHAASWEINHAKSRLIDIASKLEGAGLGTLADELSRKIGALEAWQNRRLK